MNLIDLLRQKLLLFTEYENISTDLYAGEVYDFESDFKERDVLAEKLDNLQLQINQIITDKEKNILSYDTNVLSPGEMEIFDTTLKITVKINRINELNIAIAERFRKEMDDIVNKIKAENKSTPAAYAKYAKIYSQPDDYSTTKKA